VEGFTAFSETSDPPLVMAALSRLFDDIGRVIVAAGGVMIGFAGDAVLATFNTPSDCPDHARAALGAARVVATMEVAGLRLRVGVATGPVAAGRVGGAGRQAYTVYGDTVNLAQRLEAANKAHGTRLLVDRRTWRAAGEPAGFRVLDEIVVRNRRQPVSVLSPD
jgi:class 3 adenylate cyclase